MDTRTIISVRAWARPIYLLKVLDGLKQCRGLTKYKLLISCDKSDPSMSQQLVEAIECSGILEVIDTDIVFHDKWLGCAGHFRWVLHKSFEEGQEYAIFMEDDTYPAVDCLEYFEQVLPIMSNYWAACTLNRPCHELIAPSPSSTHALVSKNLFEGANVFMLTRQIYNRINEKGAIFGVDWISDRGKEYDCRDEEWLSQVRMSDRLGWDVPMEKFFRDLPCVFPMVSRTLNIGKHGLHNNVNQWEALQFNPNWAHNPLYAGRIIDFKNWDLDNIYHDEKRYLEDGYE